jgi:hypothetical protein
MWFSNVQALKGELPQQLLQFLPPTQTLRMGKQNAGNQFQYACAITEERQNGLFWAQFRNAISVAAVTAIHRSFFIGSIQTSRR